MNDILKLYLKLTFKKRFILNFRNSLSVIADKLAEIEYIRMTEKDSNFKECHRINSLKAELSEFLMYIRNTIRANPGFRRRGQKIISRCFRKEAWEGFVVEDACIRFADGFEYKDDLRNLMYGVYMRMHELEGNLLEPNITVFWNCIREL